MSATAIFSPPYDVEREICRTLPAQRRHLSRLRASTRGLRRFAGVEEADLETALAPHFAEFGGQLLRSPYYREALLRLGLSPRDLRDGHDLVHFPLLDRDTLCARQSEMAVLDGASGLLFDRSGGSSGRPLRVLKDSYDTMHMWGVLRFLASHVGVRWPSRPRVALLCALPHGVEYAVEPPALGGELRRVSLARPAPLPRLIEFQPHVLFSDPAGLHWLAAQASVPQPLLVLTSAQHFASELRGRLTARLQCPIINYYATTETGAIAWECLQAPGRFHVLHPDVWLESVEGRLVVTRLRPSVLPLLRYAAGDSGEVVVESCRCGYRGRSIVAFEGRRACHFETPEGRLVDAWALAWLFKHHALAAFRVTQLEVERFKVELAGGRANPRLEDRLRAALVSLGFARPCVEWRTVARLSGLGTKPEPFRSSLRES